jgi:hypothetical protein
MKGLFLFVTISLLSSSVLAQENCDIPRREVTFQCLSPLDIVHGLGCYTVDVGERVLKGTGQILSAPFKAKCCIPKPQIWKWQPGYWTPGRLYRTPEPPKYYYPRYYTPQRDDHLTLYSVKF